MFNHESAILVDTSLKKSRQRDLELLLCFMAEESTQLMILGLNNINQDHLEFNITINGLFHCMVYTNWLHINDCNLSLNFRFPVF